VGSEHPEIVAPQPLLGVILGPTASGKTALSLALAEKFDGEIVNCDSVAMYREFDIGTAKPTPVERGRAPHPGPQRSEELRERLRRSAAKFGPDHLHRILLRLDPTAVARIHANDAPKLIRAIEVCISSRQKISELWQQGRDRLRGFRILRFGLEPDRAALYDRINQRAAQMFEVGLIEETERLLQKYGATSRPLASLGYRQAVQLLHGELTREQAIQAAQQGHRNYAKRQMTWFRREPEVIWLKGFGDDLQIQQEAVGGAESYRQPANT
jgi:tRNA dimethylallyltransferase